MSDGKICIRFSPERITQELVCTLIKKQSFMSSWKGKIPTKFPKQWLQGKSLMINNENHTLMVFYVIFYFNQQNEKLQ